jgi:spore coat protein U domain-containing protein, fimbrial subunit CupE1/2/3/6
MRLFRIVRYRRGVPRGLASAANLVGAILTATSLPSFVSSSAKAATATSSFSVTMTINASCTVVSAAALNFGSQGVLTAAVNQTTTLQVQCTNTTPYNIGLNAGTGSGATVTTRYMTAGPATVAYSLYSDTNHTVVWGNTVGTNTVAGTGNGAAQAYTVYGQVPAQTTPAPGTYTDTITVTVTY